MKRKGLAVILVVAALMIAGYAALIWNNNRTAEPVAREEIDERWERTVQWLLRDREALLRDQNSMLWWMIGESARVSGDSRLRALYEYFLAQFDRRSMWQAFFEPELYHDTFIPPELYQRFQDYQQYFLFSLTCNRQLALDPLIAAQHETDFCWRNHPLSPACTTHQLMAFRLAQRQDCAEAGALPEKIGVLQARIAAQLTLDPRVVDVYLQRVLMLEESGAGKRIKPRWLERALTAQLEDGSWTAFQPLLSVGGGRYLGFNARLVGIGAPRSDFHTTAQGLWLLSLLRARPAQDIAPIS